MTSFMYINKNIFNQLTDDELLIYCYGALQTKRNEEFIFSSSILNYYLNADKRKQQDKIKSALDGLIAKGLIINVANDVYIIKETKKVEPYFALYNIEFEALKGNSKLLRYFCYLVSCFNNKSQQWNLSNSFIQKGFGISKGTVIKYNEELEKLNLIQVLTSKKESNANNINIIKRVHVDEDYINKTKEVKAIDNSIIGKENKTINKEKQSDTVKLNNNSSTSKVNENDNFNIDELKSRITDVIGLVTQSDITIYPRQLTKIKEIGIDNFIYILKSNLSNYTKLLNNQNQSPKDRANIFLSCVIKKNLESGLRELEELNLRNTQFELVPQERIESMNYMEEGEEYNNKITNTNNMDMSDTFLQFD